MIRPNASVLIVAVVRGITWIGTHGQRAVSGRAVKLTDGKRYVIVVVRVSCGGKC